MFEYKDHKIDDISFIRSLENKKFTFENNKLKFVSITNAINRIILLRNNLQNIYFKKLGIRNFSTSNHNIVKLRKTKEKKAAYRARQTGNEKMNTFSLWKMTQKNDSFHCQYSTNVLLGQ